MLDLSLAAAHHLLIFGIFGVLFAEFWSLRPGLSSETLARIASIDLWYGVFAIAVIVSDMQAGAYGRAAPSMRPGQAGCPSTGSGRRPVETGQLFRSASATGPDPWAHRHTVTTGAGPPGAAAIGMRHERAFSVHDCDA